MVLGLLLDAQDTLQARSHSHGTGDAWFHFFESNRVEAALIGLAISVLARLLGVWVGKTPKGKLGQGVLYFLVAVALTIVAPVLLIRTDSL